MFELPIIVAILGAYMALLLVIALWVERKASQGKDIGNNAVVYSLSLAVYLSAWTFYGSIAKAASSGMLFLPVYLGPTISIVLWWTLLRKMVRIRNVYGVTSIADFISLRYDKSPYIAALVTVMSIFGIVPYFALQLKAITSAWRIISGTPADSTYLANLDISLIIAIFTIAFTIIIGVRRLVPTERHQGMVVAIVVASIVKLVAFLAVGFFVTFGLFDGFGDIFRRFSESPLSGSTLSASSASFQINWFSYLLLSMSAIMFLPWQFHIAVVENFQKTHIRTAMWLFPLYMFLITVFILPIALGGLLIGYPLKDAEIFVLKLPLASGQGFLSLLVFLGGFAAASGMIMIASMTLSTMFNNHLLLPCLEPFRKLGFIKRYLLQCRWIAVTAFILAGYWFERKVGQFFSLVDIGMISFLAVLQFVPAILGGLYWRRGNKAGALWGLCAGFLLWFHTLILPAFAKGGLVPQNVMDHGPAGIELLRPEHLFGITGLDPLSHAVLWTMLFNIGFYVLGSLCVEQSQEEQILSEGFVNSLAVDSVPVPLVVEATIEMTRKRRNIQELFNLYFPQAKAVELTLQCLSTLHLDKKKLISIVELAELHNETEKILAGSIGAAAAHTAVHKSPVISPAEENKLKQIYAGIIAELRVTPTELLEKINFHREKERLLTQQAAELAEKVWERDNEITERKRAEEALRNSERRLADIINFLPDATFVVDMEGKIIVWNRAAERFASVKAEEMLGKGNREYSIPFYGERRPALIDLVLTPSEEIKRLYPYVLIEDGTVTSESTTRSLHRGETHLFGKAAPLYNSEGNMIGAIESVRDITERKNVENALRESEWKFHAIFDQTYQLMGLLALDGTVIGANRTALQFIGVDESAVMGRSFWETPWWTHSTDMQDRVRAAVKKAAAGEFVHFEATHEAVDGSLHYVDFSLKPVMDEAGKVIILIPEGRDITERKMVEEQLRGSLNEKEILLKEVHHRVKNNLQVISSMLHLQSARVIDEEMLMAFKESQSRVDTMALIHAKLYQSKDLSNIHFRSYVAELITNLYMSFGINNEAVKSVIEVADITLSVNTAIPCGLIINELVTNCLKHAFPKGRTGEIVISLRPTDTGRFVLIVSDNGIGFPKNIDFRNTESLGLKLVNSLTSQMDGTIELYRNGGTKFTIGFSELVYQERGSAHGT